MGRFQLFIITGVAIIAAACSSSDADGGGIIDDEPVIGEMSPRENIVLTEAEAKIVNMQNSTAFKMLGYFTDNSKADNFMISPLSAQFALGMLASGASENTLAEFEEALGMTSIEDFNKLNRRLLDEMPGVDKNAVFNSANAAWVDIDFKILDSYGKTLDRYYMAETESLDLSTQKAVKKINNWCSEKTNGKISEVVKGPFDPRTKLVLSNALYFKAQWSIPFESDMTEKGRFVNADASTSKVDMMKAVRHTDYMRTDNYELMSLDLGNYAYQMTIILPAKSSTLKAAMASLDVEAWNKWKSHSQYMKCDIGMPCFKIETNESLRNCMKSLGVRDAFDIARADFSALSKDQLSVGDIVHCTNISVDEEGCEAAAVTMNMLCGSNGTIPENVEFHVDRPFAFIIEETSSGAILFAGNVTKL